MKPFIVVLIMLMASFSVRADSIKTPLGSLEFVRKGRVFLNNKEIYPPKDSNGAYVKIYQEDLININKDWDKYFLLSYLDSSYRDRGYSLSKYLILDLSGAAPVLSNAVLFSNSPYFQWGDNNYVYLRDGILYLGIFEPARKQFTYKNGVLSENTGPWAGPDKPEKYIVPDEKDRGPCFNVANVPECIAEQERDEAEKRSKSKPKKSGSSQVY